MPLKERLNDDLKNAMRSGDAARRDTLRHVLAAVKQVEVDTRKELSDADVEQVLTREAKRRRESIEGFEKGGRADLVSKEQSELRLIESYLPQQMSRTEIEALARRAIAESGAQSAAQIGAVMQRLMPQVKGKADGKLVNQVVRALLAGG